MAKVSPGYNYFAPIFLLILGADFVLFFGSLHLYVNWGHTWKFYANWVPTFAFRCACLDVQSILCTFELSRNSIY